MLIVLERPFIHVHELAKKAVQEYNRGNKAVAETYLTEITKESYIVIDKLKELKQILMNEKKQYIH